MSKKKKSGAEDSIGLLADEPDDDDVPLVTPGRPRSGTLGGQKHAQVAHRHANAEVEFESLNYDPDESEVRQT